MYYTPHMETKSDIAVLTLSEREQEVINFAFIHLLADGEVYNFICETHGPEVDSIVDKLGEIRHKNGWCHDAECPDHS